MSDAGLRTDAARKAVLAGISVGLTLRFCAAKGGMLEDELQAWIDEDREFQIAVLAAQANYVEKNMADLNPKNVRWVAAAWRIERVIPGYAQPKQQSIKVDDVNQEIIITTRTPRPAVIVDKKKANEEERE